MNEQYTYWRQALDGNFDGLQDGKPQMGFYKKKNRDGTSSPVAVFNDEDGKMLMMIGDKFVDAVMNWNFIGAKPITYEVYGQVRDTGMWPGDIPHEIGHNAPPDEFNLLRENIDDAAAQALKWLADVKELKTQEDADRAANWRDSLNKLKKKADERRKAEKEPLQDAVKAMEAKYAPTIAKAETTAATLRDALTGYMRRQEEIEKKRIAEERRKIEEERKRLEAERAAAIEADVFLAATEPELPPMPEPEKAKPIRVGGQLGKATSFRTVVKAEVKDHTLALAFFANHPDIVAAVEKLCAAEARSKTRHLIPGVEFTETKVAA